MKKLFLSAATLLLLFCTITSCNAKKKVEDPPKAVNVIYMIGDGTALPQVFASILASGKDLAFTQFPYIGILDTRAANKDITDSAAGGTALASDAKTKIRIWDHEEDCNCNINGFDVITIGVFMH